MTLILILLLYLLEVFLMDHYDPLRINNNELHLLFNILGGILLLALPLVVSAILESYIFKRISTKISKQWCTENNATFIETKQYKNHFAIIYSDKGKKRRKKFRINLHFATWFLKEVKWL